LPRFFRLVVHHAGRVLKKPTTECFAFLWMNLILLSHTRYESVLFFGIVIIGLSLFRRIEPSLFSRFAHVYLLTPLALLPLIFQRMIGAGKFEYPPGVPVFAVQHIFKNVRRFFEAISISRISIRIPISCSGSLLPCFRDRIRCFGKIVSPRMGKCDRWSY